MKSYFMRLIYKRRLSEKGEIIFMPYIECFKTDEPDDIAWANKGKRKKYVKTFKYEVITFLKDKQDDAIYTFQFKKE